MKHLTPTHANTLLACANMLAAERNSVIEHKNNVTVTLLSN